MQDERQQPAVLEKLVLNRKSDEWLKSPVSNSQQSYSLSSQSLMPSAASTAGSYASSGHQQSNYYSTVPADDSPAPDSGSYYDDRYSQSDYSGDLRSESTTSVIQRKKPSSGLGSWRVTGDASAGRTPAAKKSELPLPPHHHHRHHSLLL